MHQDFSGTWFTAAAAAAAAAKSHQSCPTLCDPIDGSPPGSPVPGILQARTLEWVAISFSSAGKWKVKGKSLSRVQLLETPWTAAHQAPPSVGFPRQEHWSGRHGLLLIHRYIHFTVVVRTQAHSISEVHLHCSWLAWLPKMISLVYLLASYCCCNNLPKTWCLNTTHLFCYNSRGHTSENQLHWAAIKALGRNPFLAFPAC